MAQSGVCLAANTLKYALKPQLLRSRCASMAAGTKEVVKPPKHILETMTKYQVAEATTPVHVVEGATDQIIFKSTFGACILGLGGFASLVYTLGFAKK